jgi:hypothetical protein
MLIYTTLVSTVHAVLGFDGFSETTGFGFYWLSYTGTLIVSFARLLAKSIDPLPFKNARQNGNTSLLFSKRLLTYRI